MLDHGFLIVLKYGHLYEKYKHRYQLVSDIYAIPRMDRSPKGNLIQYRGIDRDCLKPNDMQPLNLAEMRLAELDAEKKSSNPDIYYSEIYPQHDFIDSSLLDEMYAWLDDQRDMYETIFVRIAGSICKIPESYFSIGFEPSYFYGDHFSASCDCMLIPRWHGTDDGVLFLKNFHQLNSSGMFDSVDLAKEFLDYYLSFDWTERGDFYITEVFVAPKRITVVKS